MMLDVLNEAMILIWIRRTEDYTLMRHVHPRGVSVGRAEIDN